MLIVTREFYTIIFFNFYIEGDIHVRLIAVVHDYKDIIKQYKPNSTISSYKSCHIHTCKYKLICYQNLFAWRTTYRLMKNSKVCFILRRNTHTKEYQMQVKFSTLKVTVITLVLIWLFSPLQWLKNNQAFLNKSLTCLDGLMSTIALGLL